MADSGHQRRWIPSINLRAASATLGLALALSLGLIRSQSAQAQAFTVLHNFKGSPDGAYPGSGLVQDAAGNLYGTTFNGGKSICSAPGCGTVFKVSKTGKETVLYNFCPAADCTDGILPLASLIQDAAGNLYGTTSAGGSLGSDCYNGYSYGCGVVFKLDRAGYETVLYSFAGGTFDGCYPLAGLLLDKAGNLYGTTSECGASGLGTVFRLDKARNETLLHNFSGGADGANPAQASLLMDAKGNLYGVTDAGGTGCERRNGCGVVYKLSKSGKFTVLHSFTGGTTDGCHPDGTPALDTNGNLYGTAVQCGSSGAGIVWKVNQQGTETVLHNFTYSDGGFPYAGVIMDASGNLYGDTQQGGVYGLGTVYELDKQGSLTLLHSFAGQGTDSPTGSLIRDANGSLYGTASQDRYFYGAVWKLTP